MLLAIAMGSFVHACSAAVDDVHTFSGVEV